MEGNTSFLLVALDIFTASDCAIMDRAVAICDVGAAASQAVAPATQARAMRMMSVFGRKGVNDERDIGGAPY
jgi:hypothetical protein